MDPLLLADGTQTELNGYVLPGDVTGNALNTQTPQFGQQSYIPNDFGGSKRARSSARTSGGGLDIASPTANGFVGVIGGDNGGDNLNLLDINAGSDIKLIQGIESPDAVPANEAWTWTTNRHYESCSVSRPRVQPVRSKMSSGRRGLAAGDRELGTGVVELTGIQVTFHGTEATGQRHSGARSRRRQRPEHPRLQPADAAAERIDEPRARGAGRRHL